jgi:hypothetical protein
LVQYNQKEQILKTRDEREAELLSLIQTQTGRDQVQVLYAKAVRLGASNTPLVGISWRGDMNSGNLEKGISAVSAAAVRP